MVFPPMSPAVFEPMHDYNIYVDGVINLFRITRLKKLEKFKGISGADITKSSLHPRLKMRMNAVDLAWFSASMTIITW